MSIPICDLTYCIYCRETAVEKEHLMPNSIIKQLDELGIMQYEWIAGTCYRCNRIAGAHLHETVGERFDFVQAELRRRNVWPLPNLPERLRSVSIVGRGFWESSVSSALRNIRMPTGSRPSARQAVLSEMGIRQCKNCSLTFACYSTSTQRPCSYCSKKGIEICRKCKIVFRKIAEHQNICLPCARKKGK